MPKSVQISQFVQQRLRLNAIAANPSYRWIDPAESRAMGVGSLRSIEDQIRDRREHLAEAARPSTVFTDLRAAIIARQSIGDPPPKAANDNNPLTRERRVRKSTGKYVRGAMADALPVVLAYRNTPDHIPEPVTSNWSIDPSSAIAEPAHNDETGDERVNPSPEDRRMEIHPSIARIMREVRTGAVVRAQPRPVRRNLRQPALGPIVAIGNLKFSDGTARQMVTRKTDRGIETKAESAPAGTMLGCKEAAKGRHGGDGSAVASLSNTRTTALFFGKDEVTKRPINWRPFIPRNPDILPKAKDRKDLTPAQSRALIEEAVRNTKVIPAVKKCPPGVATGCARFSDQFVGLVSGSTGKGGAPNWVDHYSALRDHEDFVAAVSSISSQDKQVLDAALTARNFAEVGHAVGQGKEYARRQGGRRALIAANDNFVAAQKELAA